MRTSFRVIGFDLSLKDRLDSVAKKDVNKQFRQRL